MKKLSGETRRFGRQIGSVDESVDFSVKSREISTDFSGLQKFCSFSEKLFPYRQNFREILRKNLQIHPQTQSGGQKCVFRQIVFFIWDSRRMLCNAKSVLTAQVTWVVKVSRQMAVRPNRCRVFALVMVSSSQALLRASFWTFRLTRWTFRSMPTLDRIA